MPDSAITVREHLELLIATAVKNLELQISLQVKHLEDLRGETEHRFDLALKAQGKGFEDLRHADKIALEAAFASASKAVEAALISTDKAVKTALEGQNAESIRSDAATEKRMLGLNELRRDVAMTADVKAVKDTAAAELKAVRDTVAVELKSLQDKLGDLKARADKESGHDEGRAGGLKDYIGWIVAAVTIIGFVVTMAMLLRK